MLKNSITQHTYLQPKNCVLGYQFTLHMKHIYFCGGQVLPDIKSVYDPVVHVQTTEILVQYGGVCIEDVIPSNKVCFKANGRSQFLKKTFTK